MKIGNLDISSFKIGGADCSIYLGSVKLYPTEEPTPPTPSGNCYEVIQTPIASYTSTTYDSVFTYNDVKWYMKNNLNQYEEYGIYETGTSLSDLTYYPNKLVVIGETEYQYQSNGWVEVGGYIDAQTTYEVTDDSTALQGNTLSTTFKIPYADIETIGGNLDFNIMTEDGSSLHITTDEYSYEGEEIYDGTVTNDEEYYYYSLPSEAPSSVVIQNTEYMNPDSIHLIFSQNIYKVTDDSMALQGNTLSTTFKIPYADIENLGLLDFRIRTENGDSLHITTDDYSYEGEEIYEGTVTNDEEYYYYSLPSEAPSSVVIQNTEYFNSDPIHLIFGSKQASVEYAEKEMPLNQVYSTVAEMESTTCPNVGINEYGVVGNDVYQFEESEEWINKAKSSLKFIAKYNNGNANVIECNTSNELSRRDTQPSYLSKDAMTEAYIGDCVTSISSWAFYACSSLTNITIPDSVTSIKNTAFNGTPWWSSYSADTSNHYGNIIYINDVAYKAVSTTITSCEFKNGTVSISNEAFIDCTGLTSIVIPSSVTSIGDSAFYLCSRLSNVTVNATTPPTLGSGAFGNTNNNLVIYVPSASVDAYKTTRGWSTYASRIQAIPA